MYTRYTHLHLLGGQRIVLELLLEVHETKARDRQALYAYLEERISQGRQHTDRRVEHVAC